MQQGVARLRARAPQFKSPCSLVARLRARPLVQVPLLARWGLRQDVVDAWALLLRTPAVCCGLLASPKF